MKCTKCRCKKCLEAEEPQNYIIEIKGRNKDGSLKLGKTRPMKMVGE